MIIPRSERKGKGKMTLEEIKRSDKAYLTPTDIAQVVGCDPHTIRIIARDNPEGLGFPVMRIKTRTKIPRIPFLRSLGYEV